MSILWSILLFVLLCPAALAGSILVLGDSLSAAYNIDVEDSWVSLLERRLDEQGYGYRIVNASMSGQTTGGGLTRLRRALAQDRPDIVIVELGGNDGLRGTPVGQIEANLRGIIEASQAVGAEILLLGMHIPPNYGPQYTEKFHAIYEEVAAEYGLVLVPFLLDGIALQPGMMQPDGIHPTAAAQPKILRNVWAGLELLLESD